MYERLAPWYDPLHGFKDYVAEAAEVKRNIQRYHPAARSLLDVACGTGRHLAELRSDYEVEGLDVSADVLEIARSRCPDTPLHRADMVAFQLPRTFDVVTCLFSSIAYVRTVSNLRSAVQAMKRHLAPGGILLIEPWFSPENYWTGTITANFVDEPELKTAWMYTSDEPKGRIVTFDMHYLVGTPKGVEAFNERHEVGLFTADEYQSAIRSTGLAVLHDEPGPCGRGIYIGLPADRAQALA